MTSRAHTPRSHARAAGQDGWALIEVIVSTVLVIIVGLALLSGIDGARGTTAKNRSHAAAGALAEQELERLRSYDPLALTNYHQVSNQTLGKEPFSVDSSATWVSDSSGTPSCVNSSSQSDYLKLLVVVTPALVNHGAPVSVESVVAPKSAAIATRGTLAVMVTDRNNNPRAGIPVSLSGAGTYSTTTGANGCAIFSYIPQGNYVAHVSAAPLVGVAGSTTVDQPATVLAGSTRVTTISFDQPAHIAVSFDTSVSGVVRTAGWRAVSVANPNLPTPGIRSFNVTPPSGPNTITTPDLYPFTSGYGVFAGGCSANNPLQYDPNYYTTHPGAVATAPGGSYAVTVRLPSINVTTLYWVAASERVFMVPTDSGCAPSPPDAPMRSDSSGNLSAPRPFGSYKVCSDDGSAHNSGWVNVANTNPNGTAFQQLALNKSGLC